MSLDRSLRTRRISLIKPSQVTLRALTNFVVVCSLDVDLFVSQEATCWLTFNNMVGNLFHFDCGSLSFDNRIFMFYHFSVAFNFQVKIQFRSDFLHTWRTVVDRAGLHSWTYVSNQVVCFLLFRFLFDLIKDRNNFGL